MYNNLVCKYAGWDPTVEEDICATTLRVSMQDVQFEEVGILLS